MQEKPLVLDPKKNYGFTELGVRDVRQLPVWDQFRLEKIREIFRTCPKIIDFGNSSRALAELLAEDLEGKQKISVDINPKYKPDVVADICDLHMFEAESIGGIICAAMLEHVYDPFKAVSEMRRILVPSGMLFVYVPWIWRYHGGRDFKDYFRYSRDGVRELLKDFSQVELSPVRGQFETILNLVRRLGKGSKFHKIFGPTIRKYDRYNEEFTSGFNIFARK